VQTLSFARRTERSGRGNGIVVFHSAEQLNFLLKQQKTALVHNEANTKNCRAAENRLFTKGNSWDVASMQQVFLLCDAIALSIYNPPVEVPVPHIRAAMFLCDVFG
jgi:hypothetical protein